jgi:hypothetical protein
VEPSWKITFELALVVVDEAGLGGKDDGSMFK